MVNEWNVPGGWLDYTDTGPPKRQIAHGKFCMDGPRIELGPRGVRTIIRKILFR